MGGTRVPDHDCGWKTVPWHPIVVIEGLTCTRRAAAGRLAYAVWVEAPDSVRIQRALARDHGQGYDTEVLWRACMAQEREFFDSDGTRDRADLIVRTA